MERPNGLLPSSPPVGRPIDLARWAAAEDRVEVLIARIMPSWASEAHRNRVSAFVQRLIMNCFSCRVFTFGSVPLKTYLPDGDIDLTAFCDNESLKDTWANNVREALENEEKNENAEFRVKEVQYIQAEVKIIKCLVEDIVVDISFNQVGGLCTLCFLDEVDFLINQNHLFKKSVILIKAWCYYESRILGAHHGLISTYALETLVLYIFHVYNNSFAGPLEVLYRFLEFFSNFDWENFCLSLLGPIPVSSLPDMTAERPRNDDGELLLNKLFLDLCNSFYAVFPPGQENQGQPFVSKYFNIVDPLRINNNLGRSVSKGNFFRIRSAFAFGAKRLARLLECPKENLIAEVNQFFTNTWDRHGSGYNPDSTSTNLWNLRPPKTVPIEELNNSQGATNFKIKTENNLSRTRISPVVYHTHDSQINQASDQIEENAISGGSEQTHFQQKYLRPDQFREDWRGQDLIQFARTHSSPELTGTSTVVLERGCPITASDQINLNKFDHGIRIKNFGFEDPSPSTGYISHHIIDAADSHSASNSYHGSEERISFVSETLDMQQEEQDLVNMMASSRALNVNEQVRLPTHLPSLVPISLPSSLIAPVGYNHRNLGGIVPPSIPVIDSSRGSVIRYPQIADSAPVSHYSPTSSLHLKMEDMAGPVHGGSGMTTMHLDDDEKEFRHEDAARSIRSNLANGCFQKPSSSDQKQQTRLELSFPSSSEAINSGASGIRGQHKLALEQEGLVSKDDNGGFHPQASRGRNIQSTFRNGRTVPSSVPKAVSSRGKPGSECLMDESDNGPTFTRDKRERKLSAAKVLIHKALFGTPRTMIDETSVHDRKLGVPGHEPSEINETTEVIGSDSMVSHPSTIISGSQHTVPENSGVVRYRFVPTGPPILYAYNVPSDTSSTLASTSQFVSDNKLHNRHGNPSYQILDSAESLNQSALDMSSSSLRNAALVPSEESRPDILTGDFVSHWQNLQHGRSCQNTRHSFMLPPTVVPPGYLQGHFPWDGPGRPVPANLNLSSQIMNYCPQGVPIAPVQHGLGGSVFQHYGDEAPRYRGGTGTYLPNSKVSSRDRSSSSSRNHRGNYNHDQNDADREGNWNSSKSRSAGRSHGRTRAEKPMSRPDRSSSHDNRANRPWQHDLYQAADDSSLVSTNSSRSSQYMSHGMYPPAAANSNGMKQHTDENPAREEYPQKHGSYQGSSRSSSG